MQHKQTCFVVPYQNAEYHTMSDHVKRLTILPSVYCTINYVGLKYAVVLIQDGVLYC